MRILFLDRRGEGYVGAPQTRHEFEQTVAKYAECRWAGEGWPLHRPGEPMEETVERVMPDADWVIDRDNNLHDAKPRGRGYRVGLFISDLHGKHHYGVRDALKFAEMVNEAGYDAVFMRYKAVSGFNYPPTAFVDALKCDNHWVPWSVDTGRFHPRHPHRYDVALIGSTGKAYPLRSELAQHLKEYSRKHRVLIQEAPRGATYQRSVKTLRGSYTVGEDYVKTLGQTKALIFGCSVYRYPLQKFFEGSASGCLVMSNKPHGAEELGFVDGETYVEIDGASWRERLSRYLEDEAETWCVARKGLKNTLTYHSHDRRARDWVRMLER